MTRKRQREEAVVVTSGTVITREERSGRRSTRARSVGWGRALVISCVIWFAVILPVVACALGWVLR